MTQTTTNRQRKTAAEISLPLVEEICWPLASSDWFRRLTALPGLLFLDSARFDPHLGRYSYLTADPFEAMRYRDGQPAVKEPRGAAIKSAQRDALRLLVQKLARWSLATVPELPPFQGGAAGLFAYDLGETIERLPPPKRDEFQVPDLAVGFYDWVIALDHLRKRCWIISTGFPETEPARQRRSATARLHQVREILADAQTIESHRAGTRAGASSLLSSSASRLSASLLARQYPLPGLAGLTSNYARDEFLRTVERAIDYIHAGDVYQVNLAQRLLFPLCESPVDLYLRLREQNPAPFAGYLDLGDFVIASASPERFLRVRGSEVETRPIKGTRPRWPAPEADMYSAGELQESGKDRAENVMIVDLLRNDLGRVCEYGSVRVAQSLRLESYEFVHHLVSEVRGRLRPGMGPIDLLRASFPGGSVTGAPKIRAMQIIAELEPTARGAYCGALGFIGFDGTMDTNLLIRTFTCGRGWIQFPVGGGIVAESVPEREYEETLHKAEGMIRALRDCNR